VIVSQQLVFERNLQLIARQGSGAFHERPHLLFRQGDEQDAVFARVGVKDIGEGWSDHATKAEVGQGPGGVLARRPAAKILARHQDFRVLIVGMIQNEAGVRLAGILPFLNAPPIEEQEVAVTGALDALQELLGDDLIGVDVLPVQGRDDSFVFAERLH
jgi:hypothetical protein